MSRVARNKKRSGDAAQREPAVEPSSAPPAERDAAQHPPLRGARLSLDALIVVVLTIATFARGLDKELLTTWDDARFVRDFPPVRAISLDNLVAIWSEPHFQAFHPLHLMSYWLDVPWAGTNTIVLGVTSLVLFAFALTLVLRVMRALELGPIAAMIATLAYGLHPVQVEAVTWTTGRKEIVALIFVCLAVLAHLRSKDWRDRWAWVARALYVLAALSKTTSLPLPGVLFLMDVFLRDVPWRTALGRQLPSLVIGLGLGVAVVAIWEANEMVRPDAAGGEAPGRTLLVLATLSHHVGTAFFPAHLSPIYPIERSADFGIVDLTLGVAFAALALGLAWRMRWRWLAFSVLAFLVLLLPVLNIVPMYWLRADRYLCLPLLMLAFGLGAAIKELSFSSGGFAPQSAPPARTPSTATRETQRASLLGASRLRLIRTRVVAALGAVIVLVLAARTVQHQVVYTSDERLWVHATSVAPRATFAWIKLGEIRRDAGDLDRAVRAYRRAVALAPNMRLARAGLFYVSALRDERRDGFAPAAGENLAFCDVPQVAWTDHVNAERREALERENAWNAMLCYYAVLDSPERLRVLGGSLLRAGYRDAVILVLERLFDLEPASPQALEHAARTQLRERRRWLARFYVSQMPQAPSDPALRALYPSQ
jgi:tetratricopeptide (TPR) repeat protein